MKLLFWWLIANHEIFLYVLYIVKIMRILLHNCHIWTDDGIQNWMLLNENIIEEIGLGKLPESDNRIDMNGNYIFPGLIDSHIHVYGLGRMSTRLYLDKPGSIFELQNRLQEYVSSNPRLNWIIGHDWDQDYMEEGRYPNKSDIDFILKDKPVVLFRGGNHNAVVNSKALELMGITSETENPEGGLIDKDGDGEPTGILRETALSLVTEHIKIKDHETRKKIIIAGLEHCLKVGLTMVQSNDPDCWQIYKELDLENKLPIRVALTLFYRDLDRENVPSPNTKINLLTCDRVKLFTDGSLGGQTAALREVYSDTKKMGVTIHTQDELNAKVKKINDAGFRLEIHAIGDLAAEYTLNSFESANLEPESRPILTHGQVLSKDLILRIKNAGVIVNIQPQFVTTDSQWVNSRLGKDSDRLKYAYAWKTLIDSHIHVAGGSDAPIELPNPLHGIYAAIFRKSSKNETWKPEEKLTFQEAIDLYTKGGAFAAKRENELGQLRAGFLADFVVVNHDISSNQEQIRDTEIIEVWVDGIKRSS